MKFPFSVRDYQHSAGRSICVKIQQIRDYLIYVNSPWNTLALILIGMKQSSLNDGKLFPNLEINTSATVGLYGKEVEGYMSFKGFEVAYFL